MRTKEKEREREIIIYRTHKDRNLVSTDKISRKLDILFFARWQISKEERSVAYQKLSMDQWNILGNNFSTKKIGTRDLFSSATSAPYISKLQKSFVSLPLFLSLSLYLFGGTSGLASLEFGHSCRGIRMRLCESDTKLNLLNKCNIYQ